ncbi:EAL domain-containing protein [Sphingomonas sp. 1P06PA]|uniref:putative bifunctional diguanylate cyclase/phosphodiesterase n=1 Tax=Sphingomonas sp. 1P06PA TaxID=554121 RepID=UPI0039A4C76D
MISPNPASETAAPIGWRVVLGFVDPAVAGWSQVRGAQYGALARITPLLTLIQLAGALILTALLWNAAPRDWLCAWTAAISIAMLSGYVTGRRLMPTLHLGPMPGALTRTVLRGVALGLLWALPPMMLAGNGSTMHQLAACLIAAAMMATVTLTASLVPLAMIAFLVPVGIGLTFLMRPFGELLMMALPVFYTLALCIGGFAAGRGFIRRQWTEIALKEKGEVVSLLLREYEESGADWLWQVDTAKRLFGVSSRLARAAGRTVATLEGKPLLDLFAGDGGAAAASTQLRELIDRMNAREPVGELELPIVIDGDQRWWAISAAPRQDLHGQFAGYRGVGSDITEQRRTSDKIERMARFDALTGLANRGQVIDTLRRALASSTRERTRCALLLVDLDKFKPVNDTLGHPVGDRLLKLVAERLRGLLRDGELGGRLGGDEFALVLRDVDDSTRIDALGDAVIARLSEPFEIDGDIIRIGASVGSALGPRDGRSVETLLRNADLALYRAKDDGRGVHRRYDPSLLAVAARKRAIESALREAVEADGFALLYQPVVDADTGRIESFEALLRFSHPVLGDLAPADFMPIAAEARLAPTIAAWTLRHACAEAAHWPDAIAVSVNLSAEQLADKQLPATILASLAHAGLQPGRLVLEVSERIFLGRDAGLVTVLDGLRGLGVRIVLDDFGTGYASLGYMKHRRFSAIKIDDSFVRGRSATRPESVAIVRAVIALADGLDVPTIAEGAETHAELARMYELGCRRVQGDLAAAPMSAEAARALIAGPPGEEPSRSVA